MQDPNGGQLLRRIGSIQLLILLVVGGATLAVALAPGLSFAYRSSDAHIAIDTAAAVVAVLAAFILYGRFEATRQASEIVLFGALVMLAVANITAAMAPAFNGQAATDAAVWLPGTAGLVAASAFCWAALARPRELDERRLVRGAALAVGVIAVALIAVVVAGPHLSTGIDPNASPMQVGRPDLEAAPGLLTAQLVLMALLGAASVGFARRARREGDELLGWFAIGTLVGALARLNSFIFPSLYTHYVFTADFLKFGFYVTILIGALRQISEYRRTSALVAAREERTRMARELHDSLAQDLAFISFEADRLAERDPGLQTIARAADQALDASRGAIFELRGSDEPLPAALARLAGALAGRRGIRLHLDLDEGADGSPEERNALLRITSEAISNAIRHGSASEIRIRLDSEGLRRLSIADDGSGFDPSDAEGSSRLTGLGLNGMRDRAERLGGTLELRSRPGGGAEIEVVLP